MAFISVLLQIFWKKFYRNVPGVVLYQPYELCQNHWFWLIAMPTERLNFRKKYSKIFFSEVIWGMKLKLSTHVHDIILYINYVFYWFLFYGPSIHFRSFQAQGEHGGSVVECRTPERKVGGSKPTAVVSLSKTLYSPKLLVNYPGSGGSVPTWLKNCWLGR